MTQARPNLKDFFQTFDFPSCNPMAQSRLAKVDCLNSDSALNAWNQ